MAQPAPPSDSGKFLKGKTPRRAMTYVAVLLALLVGGVGVGSFIRKEQAQEREHQKQRDKAASEAVATPSAPIDPVQRAAREARDMQSNAAGALGQKGRQQPGISADQFKDQINSNGAPVSSRTKQSDSDIAREKAVVDYYTAPIFKGGHGPSQRTSAVDGGAADPVSAAAAAAFANAGNVKGAGQQRSDDAVAQVTAALGRQAQTPTDRDKQFLEAEEKTSSGLDKVTFAGTLPRCTVGTGAYIQTTLVDAVNSDMPGPFSATVANDVYDTTDGTCLVIPKGSVLNGRYSSDIRIGQERILAAMETMRFPNGQVISLSGMPAADSGGYNGLDGDVNNHFFKIFSSALIIAVLERAFDNNSTATTVGSNGTTTVGDTAGQVLANTAQVILQRNRDIPPTITRPRGSSFIVKVSHNIELAPYVQ